MIEKTLELLKVYMQYQQLTPLELPPLILQVHSALQSLDRVANEPGVPMRSLDRVANEPGVPMPWQDTITDDYLICLEDGRKLKILKRHLNQTYKLSPQEYRKKWDLPSDYPMVAKTYASQRSEIARRHGLGKKKDA